ncbi:MAG: SDR family NAD(P)-dependent oxidoreductase, partial [Planctomycetota bacterium]
MTPPNESTEPVRPDQAAGPAGGRGRFRFDGKVALVTGGGGAIGSAVARALGEHGADVAVLDFQEDAAEQVAEEIRRLGRQARGVLCDVRNQEFMEQAVAEIVEQLGRLDVVVHTACYGVLRPLAEMTLAEFHDCLNSCLTGAFVVSHAVGRVMIRQGQGGSIVHISSIASARALGRGTGAYAA